MTKPQLTQRQMDILSYELGLAIGDVERNNGMLKPCGLLDERKAIANYAKAQLRLAEIADDHAERQEHIVKAIDTLEALKC